MMAALTVPRALICLGCVVVVCLIIWLLRVYFRRKEYTRERFAFVASTAWFALATTVVASLTNKESLFDSLSKLVTADRSVQPAGSSDRILVVLVLGIAAYIVLQIHKGWNGAVSVHQFERQRFHEPSSFLREASDEARRVVRRRAPFERHKQDDPPRVGSVIETPSGSLAWHVQARDLLCLHNRGYEIQADGDWHSEARCWVGRNKNTGHAVAVRCSDASPTAPELEGFVAYLVQLAKGRRLPLQDAEIFAAVRDGEDAVHTVGGFKIRQVTEERLLDDLVDFGDYFSQIKARVEKMPLPDSFLTLSKVYVPSFIRNESGERLKPDLEEYLAKWLEEPGQRHIALLGEYGQGKSTASLMFAHHLIEGANRRPKRCPVVIELRGKSPQNLTPEQLLAVWAEPYGIAPRAVLKLLIAGRILLILEGFDEMAFVGDSTSRIAHFRTLWKLCYPNAKILITGRPNLFLDDKEMKTDLGIARGAASGGYCEAVHLEPFALDQIRTALRAHDDRTRSEIVELARNDEKFREIVARGSLLYVVSQLWLREKLSERKDEITSAFVMGLFIRHSYRRQVEKLDGLSFMTLNEGERGYFMSGVAAYMAATRLPNQIQGDELFRAVRELYNPIPNSVSASSDGISTEDKKPLKARMEGIDDALTVVATDVRSCGILVTDQSAPGTFRFAHKSFMEYLVARVMSEEVTHTNREEVGAIRSATHISVKDLVRSPEALSFFVEILTAASAPFGRAAPEAPEDFAKRLLALLLIRRFGGGLRGRIIGRAAVALVAIEMGARRRLLREKVPVMLLATKFEPSSGTLRRLVLLTAGALCAAIGLAATLLASIHHMKSPSGTHNLREVVSLSFGMGIGIGFGALLFLQDTVIDKATLHLKLWIICVFAAGLSREVIERVGGPGMRWIVNGLDVGADEVGMPHDTRSRSAQVS